MIQLGLIEDDPGVRRALADFFNDQPGFKCMLHAGSVDEFLQQWEDDTELNVVLSDIGLPGVSGIKGIPLIKQRSPRCQVMMLTVYDDPDKIFQALCAGATGYLLKQTPLLKIKRAILSLQEGDAPMSPSIARKVVAYFNPKTTNDITENITPREAQVLQAIEEGLTNKEVAIRLNISLETVKSHIKNIYQKLQVNSRHALITGKYKK
ncbi:LuxR family two component transcriptional regulator [Chitinophaga skermanii]|uniref:LuxR family two component transcriptional regulator n=1 Tax=Chitinophaga skermanii TaxID=331697 RepID=A0A327QY13_9BACT|nr:response regulator transcription factor [Chitinophaga skermanii]RAJ06537.1 LuxR family two component transcriptional regulator [Chitinophaga skermanii]